MAQTLFPNAIVSNLNAVINGGMDFFQRGTSLAVASGAYNMIADRWGSGRSASAGGYTISRQATSDTTNLPFLQYCLRIARNSGDTFTGGIQTAHNIETANSILFTGKTVTLSAYIRKGADYSGSTVSLILASGTGTDQNVNQSYTGYNVPVTATITPTTTWVRYTATVTVPSSSTELAVILYQNASGTAGANDYIEMTGVQLELGTIATPFTRAGGTISGELAACQRYYVRFNNESTFPSAGPNAGLFESSTSAIFTLALPVSTRIVTADLTYSGVRVTDGVSDFTPSSITVNTGGKSYPRLKGIVSGATTYRPLFVYLIASDSYLAINAEL